jgi:L-lactate dehydrogenase complex protein LldG
MTTARKAMLAKIRAGLQDGKTTDDQRAAVVAARIKSPPSHPLPGRVDKHIGNRVDQFKGYLVGQSATVIEVESTAEIPEAVAKYLRDGNLPQRLRSGADKYLADLPWSKVPSLERASGPATPTDDTSLSHAVAGVAETGTLVLASGADNPVTLNYLPENHIIVVEADTIVGGYEQALGKVRERYGKGLMPRTVNFISGPSRTGDIGGKLVMGAHGPRRLCVIIVKA